MGNSYDKRAPALQQNEAVVGQVPRGFFKMFWHFLYHWWNHISGEVTGKRKNSNGLEVPCMEKFSLQNK